MSNNYRKFNLLIFKYIKVVNQWGFLIFLCNHGNLRVTGTPPPALRLGRALSLLCCVNNPQSVWLERTCEGKTNFTSPLPSTSNNRHTVSFHLLQWEQQRSGQDSGPGQPPWLTSVEFTQHFTFFSIFSSQVGPAINLIAECLPVWICTYEYF